MKSKETLQKIKKLSIGYMPPDVCLEDTYKEEFNEIERDLEVLECFKKYFHFELLFEKNQTFLIFKSKERYLPADGKISVPNKYYEPLKEWLENETK